MEQALQQLNYAREDHVRALFEFAGGLPLTEDGAGGKKAMEWLEIHAANCYGEDKKPWDDLAGLLTKKFRKARRGNDVPPRGFGSGPIEYPKIKYV